MILPDGRVLSDPSNAEIAEAAGAPRDFDEVSYDVVIVGAGPAGKPGLARSSATTWASPRE
jgi:thioredoxin reductase (NADPH)